MKMYLAECIGTGVLVLVGCGAVAIGGLSGASPINVLGIGTAFGLAVVAMAYAIGPTSGCHINPAVTVAMVAAGRMKPNLAIGYIIAQLIGGVIGAALILAILSGKSAGYNVAVAGLGQNGFVQFSLTAAIVAELLATLIFTVVVLAVTGSRAGAPLAGLIIGLTLLVLHLPFFYVTGLSVNPARSLGPAVFVGGAALQQLWVFLVVPTVAGLITGWLFNKKVLSS
jgi:aquaporin Z